MFSLMHRCASARRPCRAEAGPCQCEGAKERTNGAVKVLGCQDPLSSRPACSPSLLAQPVTDFWVMQGKGRRGTGAAVRRAGPARRAQPAGQLGSGPRTRGGARHRCALGYGHEGATGTPPAGRPARLQPPGRQREGAAAGPRPQARPAPGPEAPGRGAQRLRGGGREAPRRCAPLGIRGGGAGSASAQLVCTACAAERPLFSPPDQMNEGRGGLKKDRKGEIFVLRRCRST